MPAKRKSKSEMVKTIPLPAFKSKMTIVQCFICKNTYPKCILNRTKEIDFKYACDSCKIKYAGKLKFIEKK